MCPLRSLNRNFVILSIKLILSLSLDPALLRRPGFCYYFRLCLVYVVLSFFCLSQSTLYLKKRNLIVCVANVLFLLFFKVRMGAYSDEATKPVSKEVSRGQLIKCTASGCEKIFPTVGLGNHRYFRTCKSSKGSPALTPSSSLVIKRTSLASTPIVSKIFIKCLGMTYSNRNLNFLFFFFI